MGDVTDSELDTKIRSTTELHGASEVANYWEERINTFDKRQSEKRQKDEGVEMPSRRRFLKTAAKLAPVAALAAANVGVLGKLVSEVRREKEVESKTRGEKFLSLADNLMALKSTDQSAYVEESTLAVADLVLGYLEPDGEQVISDRLSDRRIKDVSVTMELYDPGKSSADQLWVEVHKGGGLSAFVIGGESLGKEELLSYMKKNTVLSPSRLKGVEIKFRFDNNHPASSDLPQELVAAVKKDLEPKGQTVPDVFEMNSDSTYNFNFDRTVSLTGSKQVNALIHKHHTHMFYFDGGGDIGTPSHVVFTMVGGGFDMYIPKGGEKVQLDKYPVSVTSSQGWVDLGDGVYYDVLSNYYPGSVWYH